MIFLHCGLSCLPRYVVEDIRLVPAPRLLESDVLLLIDKINSAEVVLSEHISDNAQLLSSIQTEVRSVKDIVIAVRNTELQNLANV